MTLPGDPDWRPIIAALANPDSRQVIGLLILGEDPTPFLATRPPSRRRHIVDSLRRAGVIAEQDDGSLALVDTVFERALRREPARRATGVERFLRDGRILQYPANLAERESLLRWVAERALAPDEVVSERGMNERLRAFSDDTAVLRRYLVDFGIVERRRDGTEYALAEEPPGE
ncbi:DUF2087 domain-containing protein [Microbacterium sp. NPDC096154]|uniref:DUF2087 domain-containing protein n=1 Tax=Microbacterium sp. NPDC096154 TaxID=3155549 RepID=UPI003329B400